MTSTVLKADGVRSVTRGWRRVSRAAALLLMLFTMMAAPRLAFAQAEPVAPGAPATEERRGGEANLVLPDLGQVDVGGFDSRGLLMGGLAVAALGIVFGLVILTQLKNLPVHRSMRE